MSRIPFDKDAITLSAIESAQLLRSHGFEVLHTRFHFIFPNALKYLRLTEPFLKTLPFGAQYQVLARNPK